MIRKARKEDKQFIVDANMKVNIVSGLKAESKLEVNFERDALSKNPKIKCFVIEENKKLIGFFGYCYTYWLNKGQGVYLSNVYIDPEYRHRGILREVLEFIKTNEKDINFITGLVGNENPIMQNAFVKYGAEDIDMKTYYMKTEKK